MTKLVFFKKEIWEYIRTYKIYVVPGIFLLFGFASPILTKLLPEMLSGLAEVEELGLEIPEMTWLDSYQQFYQNILQIGILAIILTTMGTVANERRQGILPLILIKPLSRTNYILSKYVANLLLISLSILLGFVATGFYTEVLFEGAEFYRGLAATGIFIVYAAIILALTVFSSTVVKSQIAAGGLTVLGLVIMSILSLLGETVSKYSPARLPDLMNDVTTGSVDIESLGWTVGVSSIVIAALLLAAITVFRRQEV